MKPIAVGDVVVAIKDGGHDSLGRPWQRPRTDSHYRVTSIYPMKYGLGCTLEGMDPSPYRGYFLRVNKRGRNVQGGWYFEKLEAADDGWLARMVKLMEDA